MKLGFVSAIVPDLSLEAVLLLAKEIGYETVEVMCWPTGASDRRYAGVTHLDVGDFKAGDAEKVRALCEKTGVEISALGYYPNPLAPDETVRDRCIGHLFEVMDAAQMLGVNRVNTFVGRDPKLSVDDNWPTFLETWQPIIGRAEDLGVKIGIENCPMIFSKDEWPGGKNLATSPAVWRRMFNDIPSPNFGLNLDPSHLAWLMIDPVPAIREFGDRLFHIHAKDARIDYDVLQDVGVMGLGWHTPKLPGLGDVDWNAFFGALTDVRYNGAVCVEVEDRSFEGSHDDRKRALILSHRYLRPFVV